MSILGYVIIVQNTPNGVAVCTWQNEKQDWDVIKDDTSYPVPLLASKERCEIAIAEAREKFPSRRFAIASISLE